MTNLAKDKDQNALKYSKVKHSKELSEFPDLDIELLNAICEGEHGGNWEDLLAYLQEKQCQPYLPWKLRNQIDSDIEIVKVILEQ